MSNAFISSQFTNTKLIHVHLSSTMKPYMCLKMKTIYNYARTDCVYSGVFIHNPIISVDTNL